MGVDKFPRREEFSGYCTILLYLYNDMWFGGDIECRHSSFNGSGTPLATSRCKL